MEDKFEFNFINEQYKPLVEKARVESFLRKIGGGLESGMTEDDPYCKLPDGSMSTSNGGKLMEQIGQSMLHAITKTRKHAFYGIGGSNLVRDYLPVIEGLQDEGFLPKKLADRHGDLRNETLLAGTNTGLYTTMVAALVERPLRSELLALDIYRPVPGFTLKGHSAIKIPLMVDNTASDLPDSGAIADKSTAFASTTATIKWAYSMTSVSQELLEVSAIDIITANLESMGYALADHMNTDIVSDLDTSTPAAGTNNNYTALGSSTYMTYDSLNDILGTMKGTNESIPNKIFIHWIDYHKMIQDDDFRYAEAFQTHLPGADLYAQYGGNQTENGGRTQKMGKLLGMDLYATNAIASKDHFLVDSREYGWWVWGNPLAVLDYQPTNFLATHIVSWVSYIPKGSKVKAAYRALGDTA